MPVERGPRDAGNGQQSLDADRVDAFGVKEFFGGLHEAVARASGLTKSDSGS